jgi:hypothetical protein
MPGTFHIHELLDIDLDGFKFQGAFDPQRPDRPALVLLSSALETLGFIRKSPEDKTPPLTRTVVVTPTGGSVYEAYAVEVLELATVREAIKTKQRLLDEWRREADK